jgi:hypothetical protein
MTALVLGALIAAIAVLLVALPFLRRGGDDDDRIDQPTEAEEQRLLLIDERDHALAALKELEFDHRTGAIDDTDYRELVGPLRRAAADALRALDAYLPADHPRARRHAPPPVPEPAPAPLPPEPVEAAKEPED